MPILLVLLCTYDLDKLENELGSRLAREDLLAVLFAVDIGECDDGVCEKEVVTAFSVSSLILFHLPASSCSSTHVCGSLSAQKKSYAVCLLFICAWK